MEQAFDMTLSVKKMAIMGLYLDAFVVLTTLFFTKYFLHHHKDPAITIEMNTQYEVHNIFICSFSFNG